MLVQSMAFRLGTGSLTFALLSVLILLFVLMRRAPYHPDAAIEGLRGGLPSPVQLSCSCCHACQAAALWRCLHSGVPAVARLSEIP